MSKSKKNTTNFGPSFKSAVNRGTPAAVAVFNLAKKSGKSESWMWNHLHTNGYVSRRKFNGSWIFWPSFNAGKKSGSFSNHKFNFWQNVIPWAIASGFCTPQQVANLKSQKDFMNFFGPFFASQFNWTVKSGWTMSQVKAFKGFGATSSSNSSKTSKTTKAKKARSTKAKKSKTTKAKKSSATKAKKSTRTTKAKRTFTKTRNFTFPTTTTTSTRRRKAA